MTKIFLLLYFTATRAKFSLLTVDERESVKIPEGSLGYVE